MSRPGDPGRRSIVATSPEEVIVTAAELVGGIPGAVSFEITYDAADRDLGPDEEPGPKDRVRWTAAATIIHRARGRRPFARTVVGEHIVEAGGIQSRGTALAVVALLDKLGANTLVVDMSDDTDPRAQP